MRRESGIRDTHNLPIAVKKYDQEWGDMMVTIWKNRIKMFGAVDTGRLLNSVSGGLQSIGGLQASFRFHFVNYGIHVENGVGNGYKRGNNGDLLFLDEGKKDGTGINKRKMLGYNYEPRVRRPWFTPSWWYSRRVIAEDMVDLIGDAYIGLFANIDREAA